jgi:hypothetical protein
MTRVRSIFLRWTILVCFACFSARAQDLQFLPEIDAHLQLNSYIRTYLQAKDDRDGGDPPQFTIGPSIQFYLKPLLKLEKITVFDPNDSKSRAVPLWTSRTNTLTRDIVWAGNPISAGAVVQSSLHAFEVAPGYQYDIIRRRRGHLGLAVQIDLFNSTAKIAAAAQVTADGTHQAAVSASRSLLAPIPVAGPQFRLYLTNSPRVFIEGNVYGMYLFGYGNFVSSAGDLGFTLSKHVTANAGYQLGTRLNIKGTSNRIGLDLTQKGPVAGLEFSF